MRILFIHGFGENETIFSKISPFIPGEHVFLNIWSILGDVPRTNINVLDFAKEVVQKFKITQNDVIIGHSMGGWIAYHIKHLTGSPIVQIASWTDPDKPFTPIKNVKLSYWIVRNGLLFNHFFKRLLILKGYEGKPSKDIYQEIFEGMIKSNRENLINQLRLILTPVSEKIIAIPDLRIHAQIDLVVRRPRESFHEVVGDHFTLYTHPEAVYVPILAFLEKNTHLK